MLTDTHLWSQWGPSVRQVEHTPRMLHARSEGRVQLPMGLWLPFRVTDFEAERSFRWRIAGVPATGHRVLPLGPKRSRLTFEVPAFVAPYALVCKLACGRIARLAETPDG